jgi:hypothetical protein
MSAPNSQIRSVRWAILCLRAMRQRLHRQGRHIAPRDGEQATWYDAEQYRHPYVPPPRSPCPGETISSSQRPPTYSALTDRWGRG